MAHSVRENVSPALVLAIIALFCSIGGVALAVKKAPKNSVVKKSIKNNAVTGVKIA
ncbi:MAG: hypothetical protein QOG62_2071, partial [Thermoleophilaceae bacterium]|nr:hypothetical protein [Thermoleophilaceae bacterium]